MSAEVTGVDALKRAAEQVEAEVLRRTRAVAQNSAQRIAVGIRARVRRRLQGRLAAAVTTEERAEKRTVAVGFPDQLPGGLNPMVPVWHEFGTRKMDANPAVGDAHAAERAFYEAEMREAVEGPLGEFGS